MEVVYDIYLGNKAKWYIKKKNQWSTQQPGKNNFCAAFHFSGAFSRVYYCHQVHILVYYCHQALF